MAARAKKSRRKSGGKSASKRTAGKRRASRVASAKRSGKKTPPAKRGAASKKSSAKRPAIKKRAAKRPAIKKSAVKRGAKRSSSGGQKAPTRSPIARVTRVAKEVAQQASTAVTEGIETVKEFGGSIVERVTGENVSG